MCWRWRRTSQAEALRGDVHVHDAHKEKRRRGEGAGKKEPSARPGSTRGRHRVTIEHLPARVRAATLEEIGRTAGSSLELAFIFRDPYYNVHCGHTYIGTLEHSRKEHAAMAVQLLDGKRLPGCKWPLRCYLGGAS